MSDLHLQVSNEAWTISVRRYDKNFFPRKHPKEEGIMLRQLKEIWILMIKVIHEYHKILQDPLEGGNQSQCKIC